MHRLSASVLFLLAGTFTLAQTSSNPPVLLKNPPSDTFTNGQTSGAATRIYTGDQVTANPSLACPVGFFASRQVPMVQVKSINDATPTGPSQGLHLTLNNRLALAIESVEVTVYGTSLKPRALLLDGSVSGTISKTFTLERRTGSTSLTEADVWMQHVGSLRWVDLISITYTDGTTWRSSSFLPATQNNYECRAIPSNFLLVGAR
jgi:hypothetical protein